MYNLELKIKGSLYNKNLTFNSLYRLIAQLKTDLETGALVNLSDIVSITYTVNFKQLNAIETVLLNLRKYCTDKQRDEINQLLHYLKEGC